MTRAIASAAACMAIIAGSGAARAQILSLEQGIGFSLKPRSSLLFRGEGRHVRLKARIVPVARIDADDREQTISLGIQRRTTRFATLAVVDPFTAQSRFTRYGMESHMKLGDHGAASFGWQGMKLSNRNANVTAGAGSYRLRARDLFLPHAAISVEAARGLTLTMDYAEAMRAYGGAGFDGPLGLTSEAFRTLRATLRPETQSRARLRAQWAASPRLDLSVAMLGGRLDDRLSFADGAVLPVNGGSGRIMGAVLAARHRISAGLGWTLRYGEARVRVWNAPDATERSLSIGGEWQDGPLRATATIVHSGTPALAAMASRPLRVEAGLDYRVHVPGAGPLRLGLHLTDPDGLASSRFASEAKTGSLRPADQTRAIMARARYDW